MLRQVSVELEQIITDKDTARLEQFLANCPTSEQHMDILVRGIDRIMRLGSVPMALVCLKFRVKLTFSLLLQRALACHAHTVLEALFKECDATLLENINSITIHDLPALHWAAREGNLDLVRVLLTNMHVDINSKDGKGCTALHHAALNDQVEVVRELLKPRIFQPGAKEKLTQQKRDDLIAKLTINPNLTDYEQQTALHKAAQEGFGLIIEELNLSADVQAALPDINKRTPLELALMKRSESAVRALLNHPGINSAGKTANNVPMFHFAMKQQEKACVTAFIQNFDNRADEIKKEILNTINPADNHSALSYAGVCGLGDVVVDLLDRGAAVDLTKAQDIEALTKAMKSGHHTKIKDYVYRVYLNLYEQKRSNGAEHNSMIGGLFAKVGVGVVGKEEKLAAVRFLKDTSIRELEDITNPGHSLHSQYLKHYRAFSDKGELNTILDLLNYSTSDKTTTLNFVPAHP